MLETAIVEAPEIDEGNNEAWVEALPARVYHTPQYGEVPIPVDKLQRMITNFKQNVRGQEIGTDFEHGIDQAKGKQASGWYRDFELRPSSDDATQMSLWAKVEFTDDAKADVQAGKWKYWSLEWDDEYETDSGAIVPDVVTGGGLTNRPIAKRTMPINFSEELWNDLSDEDKQYAARIIHEQKLLSDEDTRKAFELLGSKGFQVKLSETAAQEHSDPGIGVPLYASANSQPDPGTGLNVPRVSGDPARDDISISGGWRRDPLPIANPQNTDPPETQETREPSGANTLEQFNEHKGGGSKSMELSEQNVTELRELVGVGDTDDADQFMEGARTAFSELKTFKDTVGQTSQEKEFSEKYPALWAEHQDLIKTNRNTKAQKFSESVSRINTISGTGEGAKLEPTRDGLSALALETIADVHMKFSEGTATMEDFENVVKTITNGGIVEFGEVGSSGEEELPEFDATTAQGRMNARKLFAEKVAEVQGEKKDDEYPFADVMVATSEASRRWPDLAAAYKATA